MGIPIHIIFLMFPLDPDLHSIRLWTHLPPPLPLSFLIYGGGDGEIFI